MLTHNVIHRDLKLANVFISDGQYKIGISIKFRGFWFCD